MHMLAAFSCSAVPSNSPFEPEISSSLVASRGPQPHAHAGRASWCHCVCNVLTWHFENKMRSANTCKRRPEVGHTSVNAKWWPSRPDCERAGQNLGCFTGSCLLVSLPMFSARRDHRPTRPPEYCLALFPVGYLRDLRHLLVFRRILSRLDLSSESAQLHESSL